jgi:hypothetical protein
MYKILLVAAACTTLAACATRNQEVGTAAGAVGGAVVGGPVGAVVGGVGGAVVTAPGMPLGGHPYRCAYYDRYGHKHYHHCH